MIRSTLVIGAVILGVAASLTACTGTERMTAFEKPAPVLEPTEVVRRQVTALGHNSALGGNEGIRRAFRFASPQNRDATGPLPRFTQMLYNPGYRALLDHRQARYSEPAFHDGRAAVKVTLTTLGMREVSFVFLLSRYSTPECQGCWLTDAVRPGPGQPGGGGPRFDA